MTTLEWRRMVTSLRSHEKCVPMSHWKSLYPADGQGEESPGQVLILDFLKTLA